MIYRKATLADLDKFFEYFKESLHIYFSKKNDPDDDTENTLNYFHEVDYSKSKLAKDLRKKEKYLYLALDGDKIAGYLMVESSYGGMTFGHWFVVDKIYQKRSVGTKLLKMWEKDALNWGCHKLYIYTESRNREFYKNRGFTYIGFIPECYFGENSHFFYKTIQKAKEENYLREYLKKR